MPERRDELLDHEVDGIHELDNALPRWWLYGFYLTIVFAAVYLVNYHVLSTPLIGKARLTDEYAAEVEAATKAGIARPRPTIEAGVVARTDAPTLARGDAIFHGEANACFSCHRPDLGGLIGPNLTDDYWLHGCGPAMLMRNVSTGFLDHGMLPFGTNARLSDADLLAVVSYVLSKQGSHPANPKPVDPERDRRCGASTEGRESGGS